MKPLVVVGASLAGMSAVQSMRSGGYAGPVVVLDSSPEMPHDRPPLSKQVLAGEWDLDRAALPVARNMSELDVDLRLGVSAVGLDPDSLQLSLSDGSTISASGIVIATGSVPRQIPGEVPSGVFVLRTGADSLALRDELDRGPERVLVIGAGFIGAEVAATCRGRGLEVTMVEATEVPLQRVLPADLGSFVADLHRNNGVDVRLGVGLDSFLADASGAVRGVTLTDGCEIAAQVVLIGIGAVPEVSWLEDSGLALLPPQEGGGIRCDESLRAAPKVLAAGDCASWPNGSFNGERMRVEQWESALEQGTHAGKQMLFEIGAGEDPGAFSTVPWFWSDQYDAKIQMAGRADPGDEVHVVDGSVAEGRFVALFKRGDECRAALGVNRPRLAIRARMKLAETLAWDSMLELFDQ